MKILRRHHGFTTNSSAASEWADLAAEYQRMAGLASPASTSATSATATSTDAAGGPVAISITSQTLATTAAVGESPPSRESPLVDNLFVLLGLALAIVGVFAVERLVRRLARRRPDDDV